jgi:hypothetical protein
MYALRRAKIIAWFKPHGQRKGTYASTNSSVKTDPAVLFANAKFLIYLLRYTDLSRNLTDPRVL